MPTNAGMNIGSQGKCELMQFSQLSSLPADVGDRLRTLCRLRSHKSNERVMVPASVRARSGWWPTGCFAWRRLPSMAGTKSSDCWSKETFSAACSAGRRVRHRCRDRRYGGLLSARSVRKPIVGIARSRTRRDAEPVERTGSCAGLDAYSEQPQDQDAPGRVPDDALHAVREYRPHSCRIRGAAKP